MGTAVAGAGILWQADVLFPQCGTWQLIPPEVWTFTIFLGIVSNTDVTGRRVWRLGV